MKRLTNSTKKVFIGLAGTIVVLVGIVMIPYPGPGWLVVFLGLTILGTEFDWAKRLHDFVRGKYDAWRVWLSRQALSVKILFWVLTGMLVVLTIWIVNGYGIIDSWLNFGQEWLHSPFEGA